MPHITVRTPKELRNSIEEICRVVYETEKISSCVKEILWDVVAAYKKLKPTREAVQRSLIEILRKRM